MPPRMEHQHILNQENKDTEKHDKLLEETSMVPHTVNYWPLLVGIRPEESFYLETELE